MTASGAQGEGMERAGGRDACDVASYRGGTFACAFCSMLSTQ